MIRQRNARQRSQILPPIVGTRVPNLFRILLGLKEYGRSSALLIPAIGGKSAPPILAIRNDLRAGGRNPISASRGMLNGERHRRHHRRPARPFRLDFNGRARFLIAATDISQRDCPQTRRLYT